LQKLFKFLKIVGQCIIAFFLICLFFQIVLCPSFEKQNPKPFVGNSWYNPYAANGNKMEWQKAIFHAHSKAWGGITNGVGTALNIHKTYDSIGFGVHCVSNYFLIDTTLQHTANYIPAYEHGTGINRTHQLVLGSKSVIWDDYFLPQTFYNKQNILNKLAADSNNIIIINHPSLDAAFDSLDMVYLQNYNCMEVINTQAQSFKLWDAALSSGHSVFIVANDDNHNVNEKYNLGNFYTCVPNIANDSKQILNALRNGNCYAVESNHRDTSYPKLYTATISDTNFVVACDRNADSIFFIGQHGLIKKIINNAAQATYCLQKEDTYIRVKLVFANGQKIFTNPIFRTDKNVINRKAGIRVNKSLEDILKSTGVIILMILLLINKFKKK
jgi:hypothetical protein